MVDRVLIGFAEAASAPEVLWSLVDQGFKVSAFARKGRSSALRHSHHVVVDEITPPEADTAATVRELEALLASPAFAAGDGRRVVLPLDDTAVWLCNKARLPGGWRLAGPDGTRAELTLDKYLQTQMAAEAGFNVPKTAVARTASDIRQCCEALSFPLILKQAECVPVQGERIQGCRKWICADRDELERAVRQWAERVPLLVQPYISGTGEGVFGLAVADGIRAWSAHRRLRMMNPRGSGSSACISQAVSPDLQKKVERLISCAHWHGLFMIELLRDESGRLWFVEINGRPWGSMALSRHQGLEYPAWHVMLTLDEQSKAGTEASCSPGIVCRHVGRELMNLAFVLRGPESRALTKWPSFWRTVIEMMRIRKGDVIYNWRGDDRKVFFADCYYTVYGNLFKSHR